MNNDNIVDALRQTRVFLQSTGMKELLQVCEMFLSLSFTDCGSLGPEKPQIEASFL